MGLDRVPRINGVAVDVDNTSVVELYKIVSITFIYFSVKCHWFTRRNGAIYKWNIILFIYQEHIFWRVKSSGVTKSITGPLQFWMYACVMQCHTACSFIQFYTK